MRGIFITAQRFSGHMLAFFAVKVNCPAWIPILSFTQCGSLYAGLWYRASCGDRCMRLPDYRKEVVTSDCPRLAPSLARLQDESVNGG